MNTFKAKLLRSSVARAWGVNDLPKYPTVSLPWSESPGTHIVEKLSIVEYRVNIA
jgi:hypothetical protein